MTVLRNLFPNVGGIQNNQTFTGNGSTTAFTLATAPVAPAAVLVAVNGIVLTYTSNYSISGTTLTFVTAPASNDQIVVAAYQR